MDLTTPAGRAMAGLPAILAEFEREVLRERTRAVLAHARQNGKKLWNPVKHRKQIAVGEKVPLELSERERDLIMRQTFAENDLTDRLRIVPGPGRRPLYRFTLDELDELAGYVAAEANHAKVKKLEKELRQLYGRITDVLESYTDESDESAP